MRKNSNILIAAFVGFVIGIFFLIVLKKYTSLYFEHGITFEINPLEVFSIIVNVLLAIYITSILSRRNDQEKSEKELILKYLQSFQLEYTSKVDELLKLDDFESPLTKAYFKALRRRTNVLMELTEENQFVDRNDGITNQIRQKVTDIWTLFTDTPKIIPEASQATKDGLNLLRLEKINQIEAASVELDKLILQISIKINRK